MSDCVYERINWSVGWRVLGHAISALAITTLLIAYLLAPIFWQGDVAVHPSFSETVSALITIMFTMLGIPSSFVESVLPVGAAWLPAISLSDAGVQATAPWISASVATLLAVMSERRPLMLTVIEMEERRAIHLRGPQVVIGDAAVGNGRAAEY
ncbi:MAG: hypothetical protein WCJ64_07175, partial [Rhodospirillaceae bacterium]